MIAARAKVLLLVPSLAGGGAERFFTILLRHLDRNSFEIHLALLQAKGDYLRDVPEDVVIHDLKCSRARYALPRLTRLIRKLRPHAVLSTLPQTNLALVMVRTLLPQDTIVVLSEATYTSAALQAEVSHWRLWAWLYRRFYRRADKVVCLSQSMVEDMAENFNVPRERLITIYYPVDLEHVRNAAESGGNPYSGAGPHLVAAGRLSRQKGFDVLLAAMPKVLEHLPQARLTILGEGPLRAELTEQVHRLALTEAVCFAGFQQNPWRYLRHADLFVLSSRYEGLPNILLEALALGTPVVATDCPGAISEIEPLFPTMGVVPPEDPDALASAIVAACATSRPADQRSAAPEVLSRFSVRQVVEEYSKLLSG